MSYRYGAQVTVWQRRIPLSRADLVLALSLKLSQPIRSVVKIFDSEASASENTKTPAHPHIVGHDCALNQPTYPANKT